MILSVIIFIATLFVLVVIHELGHFLLAKKFHIKVEEFGFGMPPKIWGKKFGETLISVNLLPLGGFVRLLGEDETDKKVLENKRSFAAQPVWQRITVVVAGVVMNLLLAWILFYITLSAQGFKFQLAMMSDYKFAGATQTVEPFVVIRGVSPNSPAESAGIKSGDRVVAINGKTITSDKELVTDTKQLAGQKMVLTLTDLQKQNRHTVEITPRKDPPAGQGPLGVALDSVDIATISYSTPLEKVFAGPIHSWNLTAYSFKIFGQLIHEAIAQKNIQPVSQNVAGPVGIASLANTVLTSTPHPLIPYLDFMALISLNLAIMNLLPIPAIDGGRLFFLLIEAITRRKVHAGFERWVHTIGFALIIGLSILITWSDIRKFFS